MQKIHLADLRFGHEHPELSLNSRRSDRSAGVPSLAVSIKAKGLLHPLLAVGRIEVDRDGGEETLTVYVSDGNRRLAALRLLDEAGDLPEDLREVSVEVREEDDASAFETSIAANVERVALHPIDEYEAFAQLEAMGRTPDDIARAFGIGPKDVAKTLALGKLAPEVRTAWRADKIGEDSAQAFALIPDQALQARVLESLEKSGRALTSHWIRTELGATQRSRDLLYVGADNYIAAGGRLADDLFAESTYVLDNAVLDALVRDKLQTVCNGLVADEGWKWAALRDDLPQDAYSWDRVKPEPAFTDEETAAIAESARRQSAGEIPYYEAEKVRRAITNSAKLRALTPEDRAGSGCIVRLNHDGEVDVEWGIVRPEDKAPAAPEPEAVAPEPQDGPGAEPRAAVEMLWIAETLAYADVVRASDRRAMALLVATLSVGGDRLPLRIRADGADALVEGVEELQEPTLADALAWVDRLVEDEAMLRHAFARLIAAALDVTATGRKSHTWGGNVEQPDVDALRAWLDGPDLLRQMRTRFDPESYFPAAKKGHALACIEECMGADEVKKWGSAKKADAARFAATVAAQKGWLPSALRVGDYSVGATPSRPDPDAADVPAGPKRGKRKGAVVGVDLAASNGDSTTVISTHKEGDRIVVDDAFDPTKLPKPVREHVVALGDLKAVDADSARPFVVEDDATARGLSAGTIGALVRRGLAAKTTRKGPTGQRTAYHLTGPGRMAYRALLAAAAKPAKRRARA